MRHATGQSRQNFALLASCFDRIASSRRISVSPVPFLFAGSIQTSLNEPPNSISAVPTLSAWMLPGTNRACGFSVHVVRGISMGERGGRRSLFCALLMLFVFATVSCGEVGMLTDQGKSLVGAGSCWSQGEGFTHVADSDGNSYPVEPFQLRHLEGGEYVWLCGVLRTATPAMVPGEWHPLLGYDENGQSRGFHMPSGEPVFVNPVELSQKFWQLAPAEWIY